MSKGFNTQPPEGGWFDGGFGMGLTSEVSTHSRPKAAGLGQMRADTKNRCFNTQPPEGGWHVSSLYATV